MTHVMKSSIQKINRLKPHKNGNLKTETCFSEKQMKKQNFVRGT